MNRRFFSVFVACISTSLAIAQGTIRGDLMMNTAFYDYDPRLGQFGTNTTQYFNEKSSTEAWLFLNYNYKGYDFNLRYDLFHNSPLLNPQEAFTQQGVPFYNVSKSFGNLEVTMGSFYDQFGSGILFRAFEDRVIGLDFAMQGVRLKYQFKNGITIKGFSGKQKNRFGQHPQVVQGLNIEGGKFGKVSFSYGAAALKRTLDFSNDIQKNIVPTINSYKLKDRFIPAINTYGGQLYGTVTYKNLMLQLDLAAKTPEAIFNENQRLVNRPGYYGTAALSYSTKGFGINVTGKYSEYFAMRTSPYTALSPIVVGTISYLPPINRQNTYRLPARYSPAVQELGEIGIMADVNYAINRKNVFNLNYSYIEAPFLEGEKLFEEVFFTYRKKFSRKVKATFGYQNVFYNQAVYEGKPPSTPDVMTHTPFVEFQVKLPKKKSIRTELQYLRTDQDLGDFAFALVEFNIAPKWSFSVSDMVNTDPREETRNAVVEEGEIVHYPTFFVAYTQEQTRLTAGYIKQVEGVVCTGGVCRLEPAFSGFRFSLTTNF